MCVFSDQVALKFDCVTCLVYFHNGECVGAIARFNYLGAMACRMVIDYK